jgi:hypothetical protein
MGPLLKKGEGQSDAIKVPMDVVENVVQLHSKYMRSAEFKLYQRRIDKEVK